MRLTFMLLLFCNNLQATPAQAATPDVTQELRVGIFPLNPLNFLEKDGTAQGINPDLLREIFRQTNIRLCFVPVVWAEGLEKLQSEELDLLMSVPFSLEQSEIMEYSQEQVMQLWGQVFARPETPSKNIRDLSGKIVGIVSQDINGKNFLDQFGSLGESCQVIEYATHYDLFLAIQAGEVDAGIAPQQFGIHNLEDFNLVGTSTMFSPYSIYFATKKGRNIEILAQIDQTLGTWKQAKGSYYYQTLDKWLYHTGTTPELPGWLIPLFTALTLLATFAIIFVILLNASVRRKTRALRESEKRFRNVVMSINDWFWEIDREGCFIFASGRSDALLGYSPYELRGKKIMEMIDPEQPEEERNQFIDLFNTRTSFRHEVQTFLHKDGHKVHLSLSAITILGEKLQFTGFRGVATDITQSIIASQERKTLEERLSQSQKMEAVGTLAGGIAHDFNNILAAILGYSELAQEECTPGSNISEYLSEITHSGTRAKQLVNQILAFSRRSDVAIMPLRPASIVGEAVRMLRPSLPTTIQIQQHIEDSGDYIMANPAQLNQVVINLATNAFHAMEESGGILRIELKKAILCQEDLEHEINVRPGAYFRLSIVDTGHGIPAHIRDKIFDPYFTTKEQGKGTGMGLAIVHGVVHDFKGYINCVSHEGKGTTFNVFLPIIVERSAEDSEQHAEIPGGTESILCVDDESMIVEMLRALLANLGYSVRITTDSTEALQMVKDNPGAFDLVITDQTMPNLTGLDLAANLLAIKPDLPIILCTGYSSQLTEERVREIGVKALAYKPLAKKELATLIRNALDNKLPDGVTIINGS